MDATPALIEVEHVLLQKGSEAFLGTLNLMNHFLLFKAPERDFELWISYATIQQVERKQLTSTGHTPLHVASRSFQFARLLFPDSAAASSVYEKLKQASCADSHEQLYAFCYQQPEDVRQYGGWLIYSVTEEFKRQGVSDMWRVTNSNHDYELCPTYPGQIMVPARINDATIRHGSRYRSKGRFPALAYYYRYNGAHITRSAQPMVGFKGNRSIQDEKIVEAINATTINPQATTNYIIDARPTANALANTARGAGTENVENYRGCTKQFISVDNIHVMRDSLARLVEVIQYSDTTGQRLDLVSVQRTGWLGHIRALLKGTQKIIRMVHDEGANVLVHCSDGWDRTSQLISLSEICLDPYFRTIEGFAVLIEKSWISFGHKFADRCGHFLPEKPREVSPVFHQFLDCVFQLWVQNPTSFEFNEELLLDMHFNVYACKYGTFLVNSERERRELSLPLKTSSYWNEVLANKEKFTNAVYENSSSSLDLPNPLLIDTKHIRFWSRLFRRDEVSVENEENDSITHTQDNAPPIATPTSFHSNQEPPMIAPELTEPDGWQLPAAPIALDSPASMPAAISSGFMAEDPFGFSKFMTTRFGDAVKVALPAAQAAAGNVSNFFNRWAASPAPEAGVSGSYPPATAVAPTVAEVPARTVAPMQSKTSSWVAAELLEASDDDDSSKVAPTKPKSALSKQIQRASSARSSGNSSTHQLDSSDSRKSSTSITGNATTTTITTSVSGEFSAASMIRSESRPLYDRSADFANNLKHTPLRTPEGKGGLPEELTTNPWDKR